MERFKESKKTVELTYDEARSMYFSGNEALKTIAIIAFGKLAFMDENEIGEGDYIQNDTKMTIMY